MIYWRFTRILSDFPRGTNSLNQNIVFFPQFQWFTYYHRPKMAISKVETVCENFWAKASGAGVKMYKARFVVSSGEIRFVTFPTWSMGF